MVKVHKFCHKIVTVVFLRLPLLFFAFNTSLCFENFQLSIRKLVLLSTEAFYTTNYRLPSMNVSSSVCSPSVSKLLKKAEDGCQVLEFICAPCDVG